MVFLKITKKNLSSFSFFLGAYLQQFAPSANRQSGGSEAVDISFKCQKKNKRNGRLFIYNTYKLQKTNSKRQMKNMWTKRLWGKVFGCLSKDFPHNQNETIIIELLYY